MRIRCQRGTLSRGACRSIWVPAWLPLWVVACCGPGSSRGVLPAIFQEELLDVPQDVGLKDRGVEVADGIFGTGENIRTSQKNHGLVFDEDFLRAIVELFSLI